MSLPGTRKKGCAGQPDGTTESVARVDLAVVICSAVEQNECVTTQREFTSNGRLKRRQTRPHIR